MGMKYVSKYVCVHSNDGTCRTMAQRNKRHQALDARTTLVSANNSLHREKKKIQNII